MLKHFPHQNIVQRYITLAICVLIFSSHTPTASATTPYPRWSTPIRPAKLTAPFAPGEHNWNAGHRGVDFATTPGAIVTAPANGVVHFVGKIGSKQTLSIMHENNIRSTYEPIASELKKGDPVSKGQTIGTITEGSHCTLCLHFGVKEDEKYLNPLLFLSLQRAILLPR